MAGTHRFNVRKVGFAVGLISATEWLVIATGSGFRTQDLLWRLFALRRGAVPDR